MALTFAIALYLSDEYALLYNQDSVSHLFAGRKLFDSVTPGLQQIGTVWLPLPHLLFMIPSVSDFLFFSGFAGLAINTPALALTTIILYKTFMLSGRVQPRLAFFVALLYPMNPSILYLGITALTEVSFVLFLVLSAFYLYKWTILHKNSHLLLCSAFIAASTLCRYEAWPLSIFVLAAVLVWIARQRKFRFRSISAASLSVIGIALWLTWNTFAYGNPFEFANADYYSASAQAMERPLRATLYLQPLNVAGIYGLTALVVFGPALIWVGLRGFISNSKSLLPWFLLAPAAFTPLSMLVGTGEMSLWFNSRFIVFLAPVTLLSAYHYLHSTSEKKRRLLILLILAHILLLVPLLHSLTYFDFIRDSALIDLPLILKLGESDMKLDEQGFITLQDSAGRQFVYEVPRQIPLIGIVTLIDSQTIFTYKDVPAAVEVGEFLKAHYRGGNVMTLAGSGQGQRIMTASWIALAQQDEMIESSTWKQSFAKPWEYDTWIVIAKDPQTDALKTTSYWQENRHQLEIYYDMVFENEYYEVMKLKSIAE
jgi:hypothetical protein